MEYRRVGKSGIKMSSLSFGSWVTFGSQVDQKASTEMMSKAYDHGVNFFDNAEVYANGQSEIIMGESLKKLNWRRSSYLVSTKLYWGINDGPNEKNTLNRKYLIEGINNSLKRLQLDHVDLVYCHRSDPETPLLETVHAMHDIVQSGKALYWGTSEWSAEEIRGAYEIACRYGMHAPIVEQPQYNLLHRERVENEYARLYDDVGIGLTIWSPLASGLLSGKYQDGVPSGSRASLPGYEWILGKLQDPRSKHCIGELMKISRELDCSLSQLAIAWCLVNRRVSSVILGASRMSQLEENLGALKILPKLTPEINRMIQKTLPENI